MNITKKKKKGKKKNNINDSKMMKNDERKTISSQSKNYNQMKINLVKKNHTLMAAISGEGGEGGLGK